MHGELQASSPLVSVFTRNIMSKIRSNVTFPRMLPAEISPAGMHFALQAH